MPMRLVLRTLSSRPCRTCRTSILNKKRVRASIILPVTSQKGKVDNLLPLATTLRLVQTRLSLLPSPGANEEESPSNRLRPSSRTTSKWQMRQSSALKEYDAASAGQ